MKVYSNDYQLIVHKCKQKLGGIKNNYNNNNF